MAQFGPRPYLLATRGLIYKYETAASKAATPSAYMQGRDKKSSYGWGRSDSVFCHTWT